MSTTLIGLDDLYAEACRSIEIGQTVVLRGLIFPGRIHGAVEYGVKLHSLHPDLTGDPQSNSAFDPQAWIDDWQGRTGGQLVPYPGAWLEIIFRAFGGEFTDILKQITRAVVADYLERRIRAERPDLVKLDEDRHARHAVPA